MTVKPDKNDSYIAAACRRKASCQRQQSCHTGGVGVGTGIIATGSFAETVKICSYDNIFSEPPRSDADYIMARRAEPPSGTQSIGEEVHIVTECGTFRPALHDKARNRKKK